MITAITENDLIEFENEIAELFNSAKIKSPVHLYSGNERQIMMIFENVKECDWIFCSWRSHYQCLLKGVPKELVRNEIMLGRSISLCFPEYRVFSSAIVGGSVPIALGVALSIKHRCGNEMVYCFVGDMTSETGIVHESVKYAHNHSLPIHFIVEDNRKSVCTDTRLAWGTELLTYEKSNHPRVSYYDYQTIYPHAGAGVRVQF